MEVVAPAFAVFQASSPVVDFFCNRALSVPCFLACVGAYCTRASSSSSTSACCGVYCTRARRRPLVSGSRLFDCSCLRSTGTSFFWESTSGNAVLRASWSDSGYTFTFSTCTLHPAVTCWVLVALRVQFLDFLGDDGCCGLLVAGLWVPTTTLHRGWPGSSTLSAI